MDEKDIERCPNCYSNKLRFVEVGNFLVCCSCQTKIFKKEDNYLTLALTRASQERNRMNFDEAYDILTEAIQKCGGNLELYYYRILCDYGVSYVNENGDSIEKPTMSRASKKSIKESDDYNSILKLNESDNIKKEYLKKIDELEKLRVKIFEVVDKQEPYDIFICFKCKDGKNYTQDYKKAYDIYEILNKKGYKVFFSEKTLSDATGQDYEPIIYSALQTSKIMFVIAASEPKYLESVWVKNEWQRFIKNVDDTNDKVIVPILCNGFNAYNLPKKLQSKQCLIEGVHFEDNIFDIVKKYVKHGLSSMFERKKERLAEIKPIEITAIPIEKRELNSKIQIVLSPSDENAILAVKDLNNKSKFSRAISMANNILKNNPNIPNINWLKALSLMEINENYLNEKSIISDIIVNDEIINCIINAIQSFQLDQKKSIIKTLKSWVYSIFLAPVNKLNVESAFKLMKIIISFIGDQEEEIFVDQTLHLVLSKIEDLNENEYCNKFFIYSNIKQYVECIYNTVAKQGVYEVIAMYDNIANSLIKRKLYDEANYFYEKSLELFSADPQALWGELLIKYKKNNEFELAKKMSEELKKDIISSLEIMLKSGDVFNEIFDMICTVCKLSIKKHNLISKSIFKSMFELIPGDDAYKLTRKNTAIKYAYSLCLYNDFETAEKYFLEAIIEDNSDFDAYFGLLLCHSKHKNAFDLLKEPKAFDEAYPTDYLNLIETGKVFNDQNDENKIRYKEYFQLHDKINDNKSDKNKFIYKENKLIYKEIDNAVEVCLEESISPTLNVVVEIANYYLSEPCEYAAKIYALNVGEKNWMLYSDAEVCCKKAPLFNKVFQINLLKEFLMILIPFFVALSIIYTINSKFNVLSLIISTICFGIYGGVSCIMYLKNKLNNKNYMIYGLVGFLISLSVMFGVLFGILLLPSILKTIIIIFCYFVPFFIYALYKVLDIIKKRNFINKKYIITTIFLGIISIICQIFIILIVNL